MPQAFFMAFGFGGADAGNDVRQGGQMQRELDAPGKEGDPGSWSGNTAEAVCTLILLGNR